MILREALAAAEMLEKDWGVSCDIWSVTSFTELRREGMDVERWNLLHPDEKAAHAVRDPAIANQCGRSSPRPTT